jgi:hypothetical protein
MIITFTKTDGFIVGINMENIVSIHENGRFRTIVTIMQEYDVQEPYVHCVNVYNTTKQKYDFNQYVNYSKN